MLFGLFLANLYDLNGQTNEWQVYCTKLLEDKRYAAILRVADSVRTSKAPLSELDRIFLHDYCSLSAFHLGETDKAELEARGSYALNPSVQSYLWIHTIISKSPDRARAHLHKGLEIYPESPLVTMEISDYCMARGQQDSSIYWLKRSVEYGVDWYRYLDRYNKIIHYKNVHVLSEAQASYYLNEWNAMMTSVYLNAYMVLPTANRMSFLRQNQSDLQIAIAGTMIKVTDGNLPVDRRNMYCSLLSNLCLALPQLYSDTAEYSAVVDVVDAMLAETSGAENSTCFESLARVMMYLYEHCAVRRRDNAESMYQMLSTRLLQAGRLDDLECISFSAIERSNQGAGALSQTVVYYRLAAYSLMLRKQYQEAVSCLIDARRIVTAQDVQLELELTREIAANMYHAGEKEAAVREALRSIELVETIYKGSARSRAIELLASGKIMSSLNAEEEAAKVLDIAEKIMTTLPRTKENDRLHAEILYSRGTSVAALHQYADAAKFIHGAREYCSQPRDSNDDLYESILVDHILASLIVDTKTSIQDQVTEFLSYADTRRISSSQESEYRINKLALMLYAIGDVVNGDKIYRRVRLSKYKLGDTTENDLYRKYLHAKYAAVAGRYQYARQMNDDIIRAYESGVLPLTTTILKVLQEQVNLIASSGEDASRYMQAYHMYSAKLQAPVDTIFVITQDAVAAYRNSEYTESIRLLKLRQEAIDRTGLTGLASSSHVALLGLAWVSYQHNDTIGCTAAWSRIRKSINAPTVPVLLDMGIFSALYLQLMSELEDAHTSSIMASHMLDTLVALYENASDVITEMESNKYYKVYSAIYNHMAALVSRGLNDVAALRDLAYRDDYRRTFYKSYRGANYSVVESDTVHPRRILSDIQDLQSRIEVAASDASIDQGARRVNMIKLYDQLHDLQKQQRDLRIKDTLRGRTVRRHKALRYGDVSVRVITTSIKRYPAEDSIIYVIIVEKHDGLIAHTVLPNGRLMDSLWYLQYITAVKGRTADEQSYTRYWKPIDELIGDARVVYFLPDGVYAKINVETLMNDIGTYVADRYDVVVMTDFFETSTTQPAALPRTATLIGYPDYARTSTTMPAVWSIASVTRAPEPDSSDSRGYSLTPLPGTKAEVLGIDSLLSSASWETLSFIGQDATKANLRNVPQSTIIHIATHGYFARRGQGNRRSRLDFLQISDEELLENPLLSSGVFLAGADKVFTTPDDINPPSTDGLLSAFEISSWDLSQTELVVLSACETGLGYTVRGQSVYGLQRGITTAGARQVVQSLWVVDDAVTRELMLEMYKRIARGTPYREALQLAKRTIRTRHSEPYFWAAFIHVQ